MKASAIPSAPPVVPALDSIQLALLREGLQLKRAEVDDELTRLLAFAQDESEIQARLPFFRLLDERLQAMVAGRYGRCERCGRALSFCYLRDQPWVTRCAGCAAVGDSSGGERALPSR